MSDLSDSLEALRPMFHDALDHAIDRCKADDADFSTTTLPAELYDKETGGTVGGAMVCIAVGRGRGAGAEGSAAQPSL